LRTIGRAGSSTARWSQTPQTETSPTSLECRRPSAGGIEIVVVGGPKLSTDPIPVGISYINAADGAALLAQVTNKGLVSKSGKAPNPEPHVACCDKYAFVEVVA
jgi:hypothetical protein